MSIDGEGGLRDGEEKHKEEQQKQQQLSEQQRMNKEKEEQAPEQEQEQKQLHQPQNPQQKQEQEEEEKEEEENQLLQPQQRPEQPQNPQQQEETQQPQQPQNPQQKQEEEGEEKEEGEKQPQPQQHPEQPQNQQQEEETQQPQQPSKKRKRAHTPKWGSLDGAYWSTALSFHRSCRGAERKRFGWDCPVVETTEQNALSSEDDLSENETIARKRRVKEKERSWKQGEDGEEDDEEMSIEGEDLLEEGGRGGIRSSQFEEGTHYCLDADGNAVRADEVLDGDYWRNVGEKGKGQKGEVEEEEEGIWEDENGTESEGEWMDESGAGAEIEKGDERIVKKNASNGVGIEDTMDGEYWKVQGKRRREEVQWGGPGPLIINQKNQRAREERRREERDWGASVPTRSARGGGGLVCLDASGNVAQSDSIFDGRKWVGKGGKGEKGLAIELIRRAKKGQGLHSWEMETSDDELEFEGDLEEMDYFSNISGGGEGNVPSSVPRGGGGGRGGGGRGGGRGGRGGGRGGGPHLRKLAGGTGGGGGAGRGRGRKGSGKIFAPNCFSSVHLPTKRRVLEGRRRDQAILESYSSPPVAPPLSSSSSSSSSFSSSPVHPKSPPQKRRRQAPKKQTALSSSPSIDSYYSKTAHDFTIPYIPTCSLQFRGEEDPESLLLPLPLFSSSNLRILKSSAKKRGEGAEQEWDGERRVAELWASFLVQFEEYSQELEKNDSSAQTEKQIQLFSPINNLVQNFKNHPLLTASAPLLCQTPPLFSTPLRPTFEFLVKIRVFILQLLSNLPTPTSTTPPEEKKKWVDLAEICATCLLEDLIDLIDAFPSLLSDTTRVPCGNLKVLMMWFFIVRCLNQQSGENYWVVMNQLWEKKFPETFDTTTTVTHNLILSEDYRNKYNAAWSFFYMSAWLISLSPTGVYSVPSCAPNWLFIKFLLKTSNLFPLMFSRSDSLLNPFDPYFATEDSFRREIFSRCYNFYQYCHIPPDVTLLTSGINFYSRTQFWDSSDSFSRVIREECQKFNDGFVDETFGMKPSNGSFGVFLELILEYITSEVTTEDEVQKYIERKIAQLEANFVPSCPGPLRNILQLGMSLAFAEPPFGQDIIVSRMKEFFPLWDEGGKWVREGDKDHPVKMFRACFESLFVLCFIWHTRGKSVRIPAEHLSNLLKLLVTERGAGGMKGEGWANSAEEDRIVWKEAVVIFMKQMGRLLRRGYTVSYRRVKNGEGGGGMVFGEERLLAAEGVFKKLPGAGEEVSGRWFYALSQYFKGVSLMWAGSGSEGGNSRGLFESLLDPLADEFTYLVEAENIIASFPKLQSALQLTGVEDSMKYLENRKCFDNLEKEENIKAMVDCLVMAELTKMFIKIGEMMKQTNMSGDGLKIAQEFWKRWEKDYGIPLSEGVDRSYFYFKRLETPPRARNSRRPNMTPSPSRSSSSPYASSSSSSSSSSPSPSPSPYASPSPSPYASSPSPSRSNSSPFPLPPSPTSRPPLTTPSSHNEGQQRRSIPLYFFSLLTRKCGILVDSHLPDMLRLWLCSMCENWGEGERQMIFTQRLKGREFVKRGGVLDHVEGMLENAKVFWGSRHHILGDFFDFVGNRWVIKSDSLLLLLPNPPSLLFSSLPLTLQTRVKYNGGKVPYLNTVWEIVCRLYYSPSVFLLGTKGLSLLGWVMNGGLGGWERRGEKGGNREREILKVIFVGLGAVDGGEVEIRKIFFNYFRHATYQTLTRALFPSHTLPLLTSFSEPSLILAKQNLTKARRQMLKYYLKWYLSIEKMGGLERKVKEGLVQLGGKGFSFYFECWFEEIKKEMKGSSSSSSSTSSSSSSPSSSSSTSSSSLPISRDECWTDFIALSQPILSTLQHPDTTSKSKLLLFECIITFLKKNIQNMPSGFLCGEAVESRGKPWVADMVRFLRSLGDVVVRELKGERTQGRRGVGLDWVERGMVELYKGAEGDRFAKEVGVGGQVGRLGGVLMEVGSVMVKCGVLGRSIVNEKIIPITKLCYQKGQSSQLQPEHRQYPRLLSFHTREEKKSANSLFEEATE